MNAYPASHGLNVGNMTWLGSFGSTRKKRVIVREMTLLQVEHWHLFDFPPHGSRRYRWSHSQRHFGLDEAIGHGVTDSCSYQCLIAQQTYRPRPNLQCLSQQCS